MDISGIDTGSLSTFGVFFLLFMGAFGPTLPEEIVLIIAGYLVSRGVLRPATILPVALSGIVISDNIIYLIGYRFGAGILRLSIVRKVFSIRRQRWVRRLYFRYRYRLFFLGRYMYGLRPAILLFAGLTRVKWGFFFIMDVASAAVNTVFWIALGYLCAPFMHQFLHFVKAVDTTILYVGLGIIAYFLLELLLLRLGIFREERFPVNVAAPYKIFSLALTLLLLLALARMLH